MLDDIYLEHMVRKKKDGKRMAIFALTIAGGIIVSLLLLYVIFALAFALAGTAYTSFVFSIGLVAVAFAWYGVYLLLGMQNIEYEYILTNSEMDIDKIMSKRGRKNIISFDFKNVVICAGIDDNLHNNDYKNVTPAKLYDVTGDKDRCGVYFADLPDDSGIIRVLFQPTYKMIQGAKRFNPRNIFINEDSK